MLYCGIDVHKKSSVIHIMDEDSSKVLFTKLPTDHESYREFFKKYSGKMQVAMEVGRATFGLCHVLSELNISVHVVNTLENSYVSKSIKKTDKNDAYRLEL